MTITHHPDIATLGAFAFGTLDKARAFVIAAHVHRCTKCAAQVRGFEEAGSVILEDLAPAPLSMAAGDKMLDMILHGADASRRTATARVADVDLRTVLSTFEEGPWRWLGPGVHYRPLTQAPEGEARLFLLKAEPGTSLPEHTHSGTELTLIMRGAFSHSGGRFGPGDLEEADSTVEHQPMVDEGEVCICLVAMDGQLRLKGFLGRLLQPFVRL
jgi:putative transcriptional regulator